MFLKRTHSHPNNTGVDSENTVAGYSSIYSALLAYLLSRYLVIIDEHQMANVLFSVKKKNKLLSDSVIEPHSSRNENCLLFC